MNHFKYLPPVWFKVACLIYVVTGCNLIANHHSNSQSPQEITKEESTNWQAAPLRWRFHASESRAIDVAEQWRARSKSARSRQIAQFVENSDRKSRWRLQQEFISLIQAVVYTEGEIQESYRKVGEQVASEALNLLLTEGLPPMSTQGGADLANHQLRDIALTSAARYYFTGNREDAERVRTILLGFAQMMNQWPIAYDSGPNAQWMPADHADTYLQWNSGGIWGFWYCLDLRIGLSLLLGYDLIYDTLSPQDRDMICHGVFDYHVQIDSRYSPKFLNTQPYRLEGLVLFGIVTGTADWVHEAVSTIEDMHYVGFYPDGTWCESTPAYHRQTQNGLLKSMRLLDQYSDPEGYVNKLTGKRFDHLDLLGEYETHHQRMFHSLYKITLPDGTLMALNDADPGYRQSDPKTASSAELLGAAGFAILGSGEGDQQQQLALNFTGTHNHEHRDMLNMHWYAYGKRLFDETRYRPLKDSGSSRAWSSSTAAHNTVVVDSINQKGRFDGPYREFTQDDEIRGWVNYERRRTIGGTRHQGELLLFDSTHDGIQVVEVEGRNAYGDPVRMYRRTLLKVQLEEGGAYVVDVFRIHGGKTHDYMLHGALAEPYAVATSLHLDSTEFTLHQHITVKQTSRTEEPWFLDYLYEDGVGTRSIFLSPKKQVVYLGQAPAINRVGEAAFTAVRSEGPDTVFVVVHEAFADQPKITDVTLIGTPSGAEDRVGLEITLQDGTVDRVVANLQSDTESTTLLGSGTVIKLHGKLAWLRESAAEFSAALTWDGMNLSAGDKSLVEQPQAAVEGVVIETWRKELGALADALVIDQSGIAEQLSPGQVIHVNLGDMLWSYRIIHATEQTATGTTLLKVEHDPGFTITEDGLVKVLYFPGWGSRQPPTFRIPLTGSLQK